MGGTQQPSGHGTMSPRWGKGFDVHQLQLNWQTPQCQNQQLQSPSFAHRIIASASLGPGGIKK